MKNNLLILVDKIHSIYDRISINIRYYFITCICFKIDKRFKNLSMAIKKDPPKNLKSKLYIISYYISIIYVDKKTKYKYNLTRFDCSEDKVKLKYE